MSDPLPLYLFMGEMPGIGTAFGEGHAYNFRASDNDADQDFYIQHLLALATIGMPVQAQWVNWIGLGTKTARLPLLDFYANPFQNQGGARFDENAWTEPEGGGNYPSTHYGIENEFLLRAHGYPGWNGIADWQTLRGIPTFGAKIGSGQATLTFAGDPDCLGTIAGVIPGPGPTDVGIVLSRAHGKTPGSEFPVFIYGVQPTDGAGKPGWAYNGSGPGPGYPTVGGVHTATADPAIPVLFWITAENGPEDDIVLPTGVVVSPHYAITAITNPSGNTLRLVLSDDIPAGFVFDSWAASVWVGGTSGTVSTINRRFMHGITSITKSASNTLDINFGSVPNIAGWNTDGWVMFRGPAHPVFTNSFPLTPSATSPDYGSVFTQWRNHAMLASFICQTHPVFDPVLNVFHLSNRAVIWGIGWNETAQVDTAGFDVAIYSWGVAEAELIAALYDTLQQATLNEDGGWVVLTRGRKGELDENDITKLADGSYVQFAEAVAKSQLAHLPAAGPLIEFVETADIQRSFGDVLWSGAGTRIVGERCWDAAVRLQARYASQQGSPPAEGRGKPVYVYVGNEQSVGRTKLAPLLGGDPDHDGSNYNPTQTVVVRDRESWIWNPVTAEFQEYSTQKNASLPTIRWAGAHPVLATQMVDTCGPECRLILELRRYHPEGAYLLKIAAPSATLSAVGYGPSTTTTWDPGAFDLWRDLQDQWAAVRQWMHDNGHTPDMRGIFIELGEGDALDENVPTNTYQAALETFVDELRDLLSTHSSSRPAVPVVIAKVQDHERVGTGGNEINRERLQAIAAAQEQLATSRPNVAICSTADLHIGVDDTLRTWDSLPVLGLRLDACFRTLVDDVPELEDDHILNDAAVYQSGDSGTGGSYGELLALEATIEDLQEGSSSSSLESLSLAQIDAILAQYGQRGFQSSYSIDGIEVRFEDLSAIVELRRQLIAERSALYNSRTVARIRS